MLFNSINFAIFLPIIFILYWIVSKKNILFQNFLLLVSSYYFYACWDVRFLFLLIFSSLLDFFTGKMLSESNSINTRRFWFWLSVSVNLGFLAVFKYYDFFVSSFVKGLSEIGLKVEICTLKLILPVGISFYTFHGLSYVIDIYNNRIKAERNFINYSVFVCFFPLLVAGPIERATHLLPQILKKREFDYNKAVDGLRQILWGLFKKIVIADNCATYVNQVFSSYQMQHGSTLLLGAILFAFQIYCDFSGYSDIALGTARLFGIELLRNFSFPYFSRDIAEFWRRWHISLTSWFKDYVYIPMGGSRGTRWQVIRNTLVVFLVSGLWHGANWTFLAWGAYHAVLFIPLIISKRNKKNINQVAESKLIPSLKELLQITVTFFLVVIGWIFFRSANITQAIDFIEKIFVKSLFSAPLLINRYYYIPLFINIILFISVEWVQRHKQHGLDLDFRLNNWLKRFIYLILILSIVFFMGQNETFIYFQF